MSATPLTRPRHALRWVLGLGLVFVVVVGMALQVARRRADERWERVVTHWGEETLRGDSPYFGRADPFAQIRLWLTQASETRGGNIFRGWRHSQWGGNACTVVLRQERRFFGTSIEAHMTGGETAMVDAVRNVFAAVDVELVVEP